MPTLSPLRLLPRLLPGGLPLVKPAVHRALAYVFGPPPFDPSADPGDPGLFGADSASWRILGEPAAIVGGIRALLVQLLHPLAMAGVADHSAFRSDPLDRLRRTSAYVTGVAFGSTRVALDLTRTVRRTHDHIAGTAPDGRPYRADDPDLLAWVSLALTSSFLATDAAYAPRPADAATRDRFVAEQSRAAALLDARVDLHGVAAGPDAIGAIVAGDAPLPLIDEGRLPTDTGALAAALDRYRGEWALNHQGREALRFLLWPPIPPAMKAGYEPLLAGALATLEPRQLSILGLPRGRLLRAGVRSQTRALLAVQRLATGPSPAIRAARQRVHAR